MTSPASGKPMTVAEIGIRLQDSVAEGFSKQELHDDCHTLLAAFESMRERCEELEARCAKLKKAFIEECEFHHAAHADSVKLTDRIKALREALDKYAREEAVTNAYFMAKGPASEALSADDKMAGEK